MAYENLRGRLIFYGKLVGTWNAKCPISLVNFTPKTSNYCLKNRALGFLGKYIKYTNREPWIRRV